MAIEPIKTAVHQNTPETVETGNRLLREAHHARKHAADLGETILRLKRDQQAAVELSRVKYDEAHKVLLGAVWLGD